jgi:hypothetical protein
MNIMDTYVAIVCILNSLKQNKTLWNIVESNLEIFHGMLNNELHTIKFNSKSHVRLKLI